jgi:hypothetical protein
MRRSVLLSLIAGLILVGSFMFSTVGCSEKDVPVIVDEDEIIRYMTQVEQATDLFRTTGLINPGTYSVPFDSAEFSDRLLSKTRGYEVHLVPLKILNASGDSVANDPARVYADHGILGEVRESVVRVEDRFTIEITRTYPDTILLDTTVLILNRYAFFLKLGSDNRDYVGWVLWGFNGIGSTAPNLGVTLEASNGAEFRGDLGLYHEVPRSRSSAIPNVPYIRLSYIDTVSAGSRLSITTHWASALGSPTTQLVSDYGADGPFTRDMYRYDAVEFYDSLSYEIPSPNPRLYDILLIQTLFDEIYPSREGFVVPYRH